MAIDLKTQLAASPLSPAQQKEILQLDLDHNGRLESADLVPRFGRQATQNFFADLQTSVVRNDFNRFRSSLAKLEEARSLFFAKSFQENLLARRPELEKAGVIFQGNQISLNAVPAEQRKAVAQNLAEILKGPYGREFQAMTAEESRDFLFRVEEYVRVQASSRSNPFVGMDFLAQKLLVTEGHYWNRAVQAELENKDYADEAFHEIHTPPHVAALEKKYGIDLRRSNGDLTPAQAAMLDRILDKMKTMAPADFARVSTVALHFGAERGGGLTHLESSGRIDLYGPFSPPHQDASLPASYAEDMPAYFKADGETFLTQLFAHELGHTTETKEAMDFYRQTLPGRENRVLEERYAEDYRIFHLSGGQKVAARGADGRAIGHDAERLAYFRKRSEPARSHSPL